MEKLLPARGEPQIPFLIREIHLGADGEPIPEDQARLDARAAEVRCLLAGRPSTRIHTLTIVLPYMPEDGLPAPDST